MKELILYYSFGGNTKKYAEQLSKETGADLFEVMEVKKRGMLSALFSGCPKAASGKPSEIQPITADLDSYDHFILAAPIWASNPAPAINAAAMLLPKGKKVSVVLLSKGGEGLPSKLPDIIASRGCTLENVKNIKN